MEEFACDQYIKAENSSEEICSPIILASKVYCIKDENNESGDDHSADGEYYDCDLVTVKEETLKSDENEFISIRCDDKNADGEECQTLWQACVRSIAWLCPYSGKEIPNQFEWRKHLNRIHKFDKPVHLGIECYDDKTAKCRQCSIEVSAKLINLQRHKISHLPYKQYVRCKVCQKYFTSHPSAIYHVRSTHSSSLTYKQKNASNNVVLLCPICGNPFTSSYEWRKHLNSIHEFNKHENLNIKFCNDDQAQCQECNAKFSGRLETLQQHKITHLPYRQYYKCQLCQKCLAGYSSAAYHLKKQHKTRIQYKGIVSKPSEHNINNAVFLCPFCGDGFPNTPEWREHVNSIHEFKKPESLNVELMDCNKARCLQCDMVIVATIVSLQQHRITHLPYSRYNKCKICEKSFYTGRQLKIHLANEHNNLEI